MMSDSLLIVEMAKVPYLDEPTVRVALPTDVSVIHVTVTAHCKILVQACRVVNGFLHRNWTPGSSPNWTTSKKHCSPCREMGSYFISFLVAENLNSSRYLKPGPDLLRISCVYHSGDDRCNVTKFLLQYHPCVSVSIPVS
jgi:hypothetical protein